MMVYKQKDIAPTLTKILDINYDIPTGKSIDIREEYIGKKILLAIIDSFDWSIYEKFGRKIIKKLSSSFEEYKLSSPAEVTSPAIATILTGLNPDEHNVFSTEDAKNSESLNLPEFAMKRGIKVTVVMEAGGANTFLRTLDSVTAVEDTGNIDTFDDEIMEGVGKGIEKYEFIVCHLRTIDEYLHQGKSLDKIEERFEHLLNKIYSLGKEGDFIIFITGDHKAHGDMIEGSNYLPLNILNP